MPPVGERTTGYAIPAPAVTTVDVAGTDAAFPVARVFCVGRVEPGDRLEGHIDGVGDLSVAYES